MKKFRGKKRYFRNLLRESMLEQYDLDFGQEGWFDLWHTHLDFSGLGNNSLKIRREHIKAYISLYKDIIDKLELFAQPYQSWIELADKETEQDAVYIHTKNPNSDNFPLKINGLTWDICIPQYLEGLIDQSKFNVGQYKDELETFYIIQSKKVNGAYNLDGSLSIRISLSKNEKDIFL